MMLILVAGARPNFVKIAPIVEAIDRRNELHGATLSHVLVHTGQHYDERMSTSFFRDLNIPDPDVNLGVGPGSQVWQTAEIMKRFEQVCRDRNPTCVVVVGDVNSTVACALTARKLDVPVAHVEAGLRSFDRHMPEEINRIVTDAVSDLLFTSEESGCRNLLREGVPSSRIHFVGNVMVDTLLMHRAKASRSDILARLGLDGGSRRPYGLLTLHRPSNVDDGIVLARILDAVREVSLSRPVLFPVHPRTLGCMERFGMMSYFAGNEVGEHRLCEGASGIFGLPPLGYLEFLQLMAHADVVMTDSGGIQEETTILRVPCVTIRDNTERPVTVSHGTNHVVGTQRDTILKGILSALGTRYDSITTPQYWDGGAADRIVRVLASQEGASPSFV